MHLLNRVLEEFDRYSAGTIDLEHLQKIVEASVSAMDSAVPAELREQLERFVRDVEVARFTMGTHEQSKRGHELAGPIMTKLRMYMESRR